VALVVKEDEAFDPVDVGLFGADGVLFFSDGVADLVEQFFGFVYSEVLRQLCNERGWCILMMIDRCSKSGE